MPTLELQTGASAFDAVAENYDAAFTESAIGQAQRSAVWSELGTAFRSGDQVLEIGCGTGVDACFLAERGVRVLACDSSQEMIRVAQERVRRSAREFQSGSVELRTWPAEQIAMLAPDRLFDGAFSDFGVLNCVADLRGFARDLATKLKPSAKALLCLMGPCCLWEVTWFLAHGDPRRAVRRFRRSGTIASVGGGGRVHVYYPTTRDLGRAFAPEFTLHSVKGIGVMVPPSYMDSWAKQFPTFVPWARHVDEKLARWPGVRVLADHILVTFERAKTEI
jgi:SAM-dependent methyltransferase